MIRRLLFLGLAAALFPVLPAAAEPGDDRRPAFDSRMSDDVVELQARLKRSGREGVGSRSLTHQAAFVQRLVLACDVNRAPGGAEAFCPRAQSYCAMTGGSGVLYWIYRSPAGATDWTRAGQLCRGVGEVPVGVVPVVSVEDFRRLGLPAGVVRVQPPNLRTLVNVPTNVFVEAGPTVIPTQVLGVAVRVRATPLRFVWRFGDGSRLSTSDPGAAYPDLRTTHTYTRPGRAVVSLVTVYSGEYSVAGGAWLPIEGTAQVASETQTLTVIAARNELVAAP